MINPNVLHKNVPILQVDDPTLLDIIWADPKCAECLLLRLGERAALIDHDHFDALFTRLRKLDYLPKVMQA